MLGLLFFVPGNPSMCNKYLLNTNTVPSTSEFQKHKFMKDEAIGSSWSRFVLSVTCSPERGRLHPLVMENKPWLLLHPICFSRPFILPSSPSACPSHCTLTSPDTYLPSALYLECSSHSASLSQSASEKALRRPFSFMILQCPIRMIPGVQFPSFCW